MLAITLESDFSQSCSFCRILKDHKNFRFTPFPDKISDLIVLKSAKTHFDQFRSFLPDVDFFPALPHITKYGPLTTCKVSEKTNKPIPRKLTDGSRGG